MLTTANIATAIFALAAFGIIRNQVRANGFFAGVIFSIGPLIGLVIMFGVIFAFGTALSLAANNFVEKQEAPRVQQGYYHDSPADALEHMIGDPETQYETLHTDQGDL